MIRRSIQKLRISHKLFEIAHRACKIQPVAETLIRYEAEGQDLSLLDRAVMLIDDRLPSFFSKTDEDPGGSEFVNVVIEIVDSERFEIRDKERGMKGRRVDDRAGHDFVAVEEFHQTT